MGGVGFVSHKIALPNAWFSSGHWNAKCLVLICCHSSGEKEPLHEGREEPILEVVTEPSGDEVDGEGRIPVVKIVKQVVSEILLGFRRSAERPLSRAKGIWSGFLGDLP